MKNLLPERMRSSGMSVQRIVEGLQRRVRDLPHQLAWHLGWNQARENRVRIQQYHNIHAGKRCVIMGNGPSLKTMDLSKIMDEIVFGLNRIYLLFDDIPFRPSYLVAINELVLEQFASDFKDIKIKKFLNWNLRNKFDQSDDSIVFVKTRYGLSDKFSIDLKKPISSGGTVTFIAMQLAFFMGFEEVILIGVDHNFQSKGVPNTTEIMTLETDKDHFDPEYFPKGVKWQLPDLQRSEIAYNSARKAFEADGRRIVDATVNGKCKIFPKVDYQKYFNE